MSRPSAADETDMSPSDFQPIEIEAARRCGGESALAAALTAPEPPESLAMVGDDRYLSVMSRRIFRAGLKHSLVDARWPAFEAAFHDFDPDTVASMDDAELNERATDERLIRHRTKIQAVRANARAIRSVADEFGSMGSWLAAWPEEEIVDLWAALRDRFTQLGGRSAPAFLRMVGKDTFLLTDWVVKALRQWDGYKDGTASKRDLHAIQARFNAWADHSGRPLCQISQILAYSVD